MKLSDKIIKIAEKIRTSEFKSAEVVARAIENMVRRIFPKSYIFARFNPSIAPSIFVEFTLGKGRSEWANGIKNNDPAHHSFHIFLDKKDKEGTIENPLELTLGVGGCILIKPKEGSHLAFDRVKVPFRKKTGAPDKIIKHLEDYFKKLKTVLNKNKDNLPENSKFLIKNL